MENKARKKKKRTQQTAALLNHIPARTMRKKRRSVNDSRAHRHHNAQGQNTPAEICKKLRLRNGHRKPQ